MAQFGPRRRLPHDWDGSRQHSRGPKRALGTARFCRQKDLANRCYPDVQTGSSTGARTSNWVFHDFPAGHGDLGITKLMRAIRDRHRTARIKGSNRRRTDDVHAGQGRFRNLATAQGYKSVAEGHRHGQIHDNVKIIRVSETTLPDHLVAPKSQIA